MSDDFDFFKPMVEEGDGGTPEEQARSVGQDNHTPLRRSAPVSITNREFLQGIFGHNWHFAHVTGFPDDPSNITPDRRGQCWGGGHFSRLEDVLVASGNNYFCISLFRNIDGKAVRRKDEFLATVCIVADDVREKIPEVMIRRLPPPSWILRTSEGSEQWGWILVEPCTDRSMVENLLEGWIQSDLVPNSTDPGMRGVTRYVRLPVGSNTKAKYGAPWACQLILWEPENKTTLEALAAPFNVVLDVPFGAAREGGDSGLWPEDAPVMQWLNDHTITDKGEGEYLVECPWLDEHTDGDTSGTWLRTLETGGGEFKCHHGHCQDRGFNDFLEKTGLKGAHDTWRAFRSVPRGCNNSGYSSGNSCDKPDKEACHNLNFWLPAPATGPDVHDTNLPAGSCQLPELPADRVMNGLADFWGEPRPQMAQCAAEGSDAPQNVAAPPEVNGHHLGNAWTPYIEQIPVEGDVPADLLQQIVEAIAQLGDIERGLAVAELKRRLGRRMRGQEVDRAIATARGRAVAARADNATADSVLNGHILIESVNKLYRIRDDTLMNLQAFDMSYGHLEFWGEEDALGNRIKLKPSEAFMAKPNKLVAAAQGWYPVPEPIIQLGDKVLANTYRPPTMVPVAGDVSMWLTLIKHWCGEERGVWMLFVKHLADALRNPQYKQRWQWLWVGVPREGKTSMLQPILMILGHAARVLKNDDIAGGGWGDYFKGAKVLVVEEIYQPGNKAFYNSIKTKLANDEMEALNLKGGAIVYQLNLFAMYLFSNHEDALHFDDNDEKLMVCEQWLPLPGMDREQRTKWFDDYYKWLNSGGAQAVFAYLLSVDIDDDNWGGVFAPYRRSRLPFKTAAYSKMVKESKPEYQRRLEEMIEDEVGPFGSIWTTSAAIKMALDAEGYKSHGRGIANVLKGAGYRQYKRQRKMEGINHSDRLWTREDLDAMSAREIFDWSMNNGPSLGGGE